MIYLFTISNLKWDVYGSYYYHIEDKIIICECGSLYLYKDNCFTDYETSAKIPNMKSKDTPYIISRYESRFLELEKLIEKHVLLISLDSI